MSLLFSDLKTEVKQRATQGQSGTEYNTTTDNIVNSSLFRVGRECNWRNLRRKATITTEAEYSTGSGAVSVTENSNSVTITGAALITNGIQVGRRIELGGSSKTFTIATITGETTLTVSPAYDGTTSTTQTYKVYGREEYNVPIQAGRISMLWHEDYGYPYVMHYVTDEDFYGSGVTIEEGNTPLYWRQWGEDNVIEQPLEASVLRVYSSSASDTSVTITITGIVAGYPDQETITVTGTGAVSGSKSFSKVERVSKASSSVGRITVDANSSNTIVAVLPAGDATSNIMYKKLQIWPLPTRVFNINVEYYKDPWRLVNDGDIHELGQEFDEAIILLSVSKIMAYQGKTKDADKYFGFYSDEIKSLKKKNADIAPWNPRLLKPKESRSLTSGKVHKYLGYGQLGGQFGPVA